MISLVYVSSATRSFSDSDLAALLKECRENNGRRDISGMLLCRDLNFIQVLEGPDDAVHEVYKAICGDERHTGMIRLLERQIEQRQFPDWTMGFGNLNDPALRALPGFSEFLNEPLDSPIFRTDPSRARRLLELFRLNMKN